MSAKQTGKVALVTGSGRGIGKAIALRLARDGHHVAINDIEALQSDGQAVVKEIEAMGLKSKFYLCDVSSFDAVHKMVADIAKDLGSLDICVANAGIAQVKPLIDCEAADLERIMNVNYHGVANCYIASAKQMIKQGTEGRIIGAASIVAYRPFPLLSPYSASKWAVKGLTQGAAMEWAKHNIRVCAYAPGIVGTGMWDLIDDGLGAIAGTEKNVQRDSYVKSLIHLGPGRISVPEDVAKVVSFLSGPDAEYMTGQTVVVDGGMQFA